MDSQDERRYYRRYPFTENILIDGMKICRSTDISEGGIFVTAIQHFEENELIDITIPFKDCTTKLKGRVRYYQFGIGMGIMFVDLTDEQREQLMKIIEDITVTS